MKYTLICLAMLVMCIAAEATPMVTDSSSLLDKAKYFQADLHREASFARGVCVDCAGGAAGNEAETHGR